MGTKREGTAYYSNDDLYLTVDGVDYLIYVEVEADFWEDSGSYEIAPEGEFEITELQFSAYYYDEDKDEDIEVTDKKLLKNIESYLEEWLYDNSSEFDYDYY